MGPTNKPILTDPASHSQITDRSHQSEPRLTPLDLATLAYGSEDKPHSHRSQIALTGHRSTALDEEQGLSQITARTHGSRIGRTRIVAGYVLRKKTCELTEIFNDTL